MAPDATEWRSHVAARDVGAYISNGRTTMILRKGLLKRIHVDKHVIARNRKHGTNDPAITVQTSKGPIKAKAVDVVGPGRMIYRPEKPLSCGAVAWFETKAEVEVRA